MEGSLKKKIITALRALIDAINNGQCDNLTTEQYDKLIECMQLIIEIREKPTRRTWKFWK